MKLTIGIITTIFAFIIGVAWVTSNDDYRSQQNENTQLTKQLNQDNLKLAAINNRLTASNPTGNVITCADLNMLLNGYNEANSENAIGLNTYLTANGAGYTIPLPTHCYKS